MNHTSPQPPVDPRRGRDQQGPHALSEAATVDLPHREDADLPGDPDEVLGEQLDLYLEGLRTGQPSDGSNVNLDARLEPLKPVVDQLHRLAYYLTSDPAAEATGNKPETVDSKSPPAAGDTAPSTPADAGAVAAGPEPQIGKYQIVRRLGGGGQAAAYLAFDPDLRRQVVLKLYHAAHTTPDWEMILREGQALARVRSPNVAQCFSAERHEGVPYLVVEYVPGRNLAEMQRGQPRMALDRALELVRQVAEGLAEVHARGLLHRDLKPANIIVGHDGRPRLVDFGLAVPLAGEGLRGVSGTLAYMAPEQARGEVDRIDARSDIFGLGAVLYELLTGQPPYRAASQDELWRLARAGEVVPPQEHNPAVPMAVNDLCLRCLAPDPGRRFTSAGDLVHALERWQRRRRWTRRRHFALLGAVALALVVLLPLGLLSLFSRNDRPEAFVDSSSRDKGQKVENKDRIDSGKVPKPVQASPRTPDGQPPRHDFGLHVVLMNKPAQGSTKFRPFPTDNAGVYQLRDGDRIRIRIQADRSAYMGVWYVDASGRKKHVQLFPNKHEGARKEQTLAIPGAGEEDSYAIEAEVGEGVEYLYVLAATKPWKPLKALRGAGKDDVYTVVEGKDLETRVRGLKLVEEVKVAEVIVPFQVSPRK
jgi:serine/threonine protein kinase